MTKSSTSDEADCPRIRATRSDDDGRMNTKHSEGRKSYNDHKQSRGHNGPLKSIVLIQNFQPMEEIGSSVDLLRMYNR